MKKSVLVITFLLLSFGYVTGAVNNVPGDYSSIQTAIDNSSDYDTVLVAPGTYTESLNYGGKLIVVMSSDGPEATTITNSSDQDLVVFSNNETSEAVLDGFRLLGGYIGVLCENAGPTIRGNIITGQNILNWGAISLGGDGYATVGNSPAIIINNTIVNCANGGISTFSSEAAVIKNNIIAFNSHYAIHRHSMDDAHPELTYNDFFGNGVLFQNIDGSGEGNIYLNPNFVEGVKLNSGSPCIDAGDPEASYNDPDGSRNDMGALPYVPGSSHDPSVLHVPADYSTIQLAADQSIDGDTILVAPGTYMEAIDIYTNIVIVSESGPEVTKIVTMSSPLETNFIYEPIDSTENDRNHHIDLMSLDDGWPAVLKFSDNSLNTSVISGFTIDGGLASRGIYGLGVSPTVEKCIIENCVGPYDGGAIFFQDGSPLIENNLFRNNMTPISGGAVFIRLGVGYGTARIIGNTMHDNISGNGPAVSLIEGDDAIVERNVAYHNIATPGSTRRGAIYIRGGDIKVHNNTSDFNTVGISLLDTKNADVRNNNITSNFDFGLELVLDYGLNENYVYDYNNVWNNVGGDYGDLTPIGNNISVDPIYLNTTEGPYFLDIASPCIDAGDPDPAYNDPDGSRNDIGARPYEVVTAVTPRTLYVPSEYPTIMTAINDAIHYDTVLVAPGTYNEAVNFIGKWIIVKSSDGPLVTTITSDPSTDLVVFNHNETSASVLEGFTLLGGRIGVLCENAGPTIRNNILKNQNIYNWGAISLGGYGYATHGASPAVIVNNTIVHCANGGISTFSTVPAVIKNNIIAFNNHYAIHRNSTSIAHPDLSYNDFYGNQVLFQNITDYDGTNIYEDPMMNPNYTLMNGSPCIDAGDPDAMYFDPDGSRNDIGAVPYEESSNQDPDIYVEFDIKPGSCPNPLNTKKPKAPLGPTTYNNNSQKLVVVEALNNGVFPVAILGLESFDINDIDYNSITLNGIYPLRFSFEDVSTPGPNAAEQCECNDDGGDGYTDLTLKFDKTAIVESLVEVYDGDIIELSIKGTLNDGTVFEGYDCVLILGDKTPTTVSSYLLQNNPNPFNPSTNISFNLPEGSHVQIEVININGQKITELTNKYYGAGLHSVIWYGDDYNGNRVSSGMYFYRLISGSIVETKKMILMK